MEPLEFMQNVAAQIARDLTANDAIKRFTSNSELIGGYAKRSTKQHRGLLESFVFASAKRPIEN